MFGRSRINSRRELVRAELEESLDLFRQAAVHAAGGLGATVGPSYGSARERINSARGFVGPTTQRLGNVASTSWDSTIAAIAPIAEAARQGAAKAQKLEVRNSKKRMGRANGGTSSRRVSGRIMIMLAGGAAVGAAGALVVRRRNRARWAEYEPSGPAADMASREQVSTSITSWAKDQSKSAYDSMRQKIHHATGESADKMETVAQEMSEGAKKADQATEGSSQMAGKSEARSNDPSPRTPGATQGDPVDDLLRSAKNGQI